jgi:hypothetical protein
MATVAALALITPAVAQNQPKPIETEQEASQELGAGQEALQEGTAPGAVDEPAGDMAAEEEAAPPPEMSFLEVQDEAQFLADEEVIGKDVVNVREEQVGTIADLVMDQEQKLVGVVLSVGGFLGIGEKWVAIPVDQVEFPSRDQPARLLVAVTEEQLKNAPDFATRATLEAEQAAAEAQQRATDQQQQIPSPTTGTQ